MGLAASQARLILLTGRNSQLQIDINKVSEERMQLSNQISQYQQELLDQNSNGDKCQSSPKGMFGSIIDTGCSILGMFGSAGKAVGSIISGISDTISSLFGGSQASGSVGHSKEWLQQQIQLLQTKDGQLEQKQKIDETQQKAVSTELDSVQKIIDKDIQSSFKTFG